MVSTGNPTPPHLDFVQSQSELAPRTEVAGAGGHPGRPSRSPCLGRRAHHRKQGRPHTCLPHSRPQAPPSVRRCIQVPRFVPRPAPGPLCTDRTPKEDFSFYKKRKAQTSEVAPPSAFPGNCPRRLHIQLPGLCLCASWLYPE